MLLTIRPLTIELNAQHRTLDSWPWNTIIYSRPMLKNMGWPGYKAMEYYKLTSIEALAGNIITSINRSVVMLIQINSNYFTVWPNLANAISRRQVGRLHNSILYQQAVCIIYVIGVSVLGMQY
jgi:hypothetical protein